MSQRMAAHQRGAVAWKAPDVRCHQRTATVLFTEQVMSRLGPPVLSTTTVATMQHDWTATNHNNYLNRLHLLDHKNTASLQVAQLGQELRPT